MQRYHAPLILLCLFITTIVQTIEAREGAFILVSRELKAQDLVQGVPFNVTYEVHNAGKGDALKVSLEDPNFDEKHFEVLDGSLKATWETIKPGETKLAVVMIRPLETGDFGARPLKLSYKSSNTNVDHDSTALASEIIFVYAKSSYERLKGFHSYVLTLGKVAYTFLQFAWLVFFSGTGLLVGVPFAVYMKTKPVSGKAHSKRKAK
eukprot:jgi/Galph1/3119/GphlegSOOS_G1805.1